ncbi:Serine-threonine/tyrosine-protein kinase, catalytic domain [Sesbania bispinosa]|nr:Serine-threonine/tyrosine-protein kinase, catalytic domain [Sesbania bispinosa]
MSFALFLLIFLSHHALPALADPRATEAAVLCTNRTSPMLQRQVFITNFYNALEALTSLVTTQRYGAIIKGTQNSTVYISGECMKDLSKPDCDVCFAQIKTRVLRCSPLQRGICGGRLFFDGCYLRYEDYNFFNQSFSSQDTTVCGSKDFSGNKSVYKANVLELVRNLSVEAPKNDRFFVGSVSRRNVTVYGLAQCWKFVNGSLCQNCLAEAVTRIGSCTQKQEGRVLNAGCYLRYSTQKFYNDNSSNPAPLETQGSGSRNVGIIVAESSAALATLLIVATVIFFVRMNVLKRRRERRQFGAFLETVNESKLNTPYEILEKATNYFNDSNKLGEGGSGSVYKGALPDGTTVAIKRLSFNTTQWADHFFNEIHQNMKHRGRKYLVLKTKGYMAPEYIVLGKLTEKADVYSFGVLVIEIVSGKSCRSVVQDSCSILHTVKLL